MCLLKILVGKIIGIVTDFGLNDYYVAAMKGVIKNICPDVEIIDITHGIPKWSVLDASYILSCCYDDFPRDTVFLVVVDPGVGTQRHPIAIRSRNYYWVAPDNGVATNTALRDGILETRIIENSRLFWKKKSYTFHGRDIFAPTAAWLACGFPFEKVGRILNRPVVIKEMEPIIQENVLIAHVIHIDDFGNAALSVSKKLIEELGVSYGDKIYIEVRNKRFSLPFLESFGKVEKGEPLMLVNSCGKLEIALNRGNASRYFALSQGDEVKIIL